MKPKQACVVVLAFVLVACSTFIQQRIVIDLAPQAGSEASSSNQILDEVRNLFALNDFKLTYRGTAADWENWAWKGPRWLPGLHASVLCKAATVEVLLTQDDDGFIYTGHSAKYQLVWGSLTESLASRFGANRVRVH